jgi:hypothetical protein
VKLLHTVTKAKEAVKAEEIAKLEENNNVSRVCIYYCSTYYKAVRVWGGGKQWRTWDP